LCYPIYERAVMLGISFILDLVFIYFSSYLNSPPPSLFVCVCDREREREREEGRGGRYVYIPWELLLFQFGCSTILLFLYRHFIFKICSLTY